MLRQKNLAIVLLLALFFSGVLAAQLTAQTGWGRFFLIFTDNYDSHAWWESSTVVDPLNGVHSVFHTQEKLYYAYCPADCDNPDHWTAVPLATLGTYSSLARPSLAVNANGRPRLMWFHEDQYKYAECNTNCTNAANWTTVTVPLAEESFYIYPLTKRYFALDSQGWPGFVVHAYKGFQYTTCTSNCTTASNWHSTLLDFNESINRPQLVFNSSNQPRVMGLATDDDTLVYLQCNTNCAQVANWQRVMLDDEVGYWGNFSFRLDKQNRPRVAFYDGNSNNPNLYYTWSNTNALIAGNWFKYSLPYAPASERTVDLAFNSQNKPSLAFGSVLSNLGYAECTADCETSNPVWHSLDIETSDDLNASDPIPPDPGCVVSTWFLGEYPSLALDASDTPYISYYARHAQYCQGTISNNAWSIRLVHSGEMAVGRYKVYLPLVIK
jgi:hypothetical protein